MDIPLINCLQFLSDKGSEYSGKNMGLKIILTKEADCKSIIFNFCENHAIHNSFGDGLKFIENPKYYKKLLYKFR